MCIITARRELSCSDIPHKQYICIPTGRRPSGYWILNRTQSRTRQSFSAAWIGYGGVREARKIKELQRTLFAYNSAIVLPQRLARRTYKVKISHFYTFVLFRETYNIIGRYYNTCVSPQVTRHTIWVYVLCVYNTHYLYYAYIYTYTLVTREKCVNSNNTLMQYTKNIKIRINFHVPFEAIVIFIPKRSCSVL